MTTGLMPKIALQALKTCSPLEPDWLAKAAAKKFPHRDELPPQPLTDRQPSESFSLPVLFDKDRAGKRDH